ncbi:hypothetical protein KFL_017750010 [Klebsormidium nitens]|uniref:Uncharacterized protein n=1 Tax=Klebsormidium nitens TaxID=105231 RepID=A0A1Y1IW69_KLENI|nr:hypothetical protein KFL_017750010 [Klebsormidium nitens]|eukprot:GAQ93661.1 hypothetical protein KFL_017750010 [Klebsormidium nitens]
MDRELHPGDPSAFPADPGHFTGDLPRFYATFGAPVGGSTVAPTKVSAPPPAPNLTNKDSTTSPPAFRPAKFGRPFRGTPKDEGHRARRFIAKIEMIRRTTPGVANAQLRYGTIDSSRSYFELRNMKVGESESLLNFGQRLRDRIFDANVVDENVKITIFINSLAEPLKSQLNTRLPATFDQAVDEADFLSRRIQTTTIPIPTMSTSTSTITRRSTPLAQPS